MFQVTSTVLAIGLAGLVAAAGLEHLAPIQAHAQAKIAAFDTCAGAQAGIVSAIDSSDPGAFAASVLGAQARCQNPAPAAE